MPGLRIASYFESRLGRNDGNPLYMWNAFKQVPGIESGHLVPFGDLTKFGTWDLHFEADWGEDALKGILPYQPVDIPHPSCFWNSDTHICQESYQWRLDHSRKFDFVFCAQRKAVEDFKRDGIPNPIWMPHAVEPLAYPRIAAIKKYDVGFVGHINSENRIEALDRLFKEFPNFYYGQRLFEAAAEKYSQSRIVFNISINQDLNMRTLESMATGSFLLTSRNPEVEAVFQDGFHCVMYDSLDDMVDKARYYLANEDEREKIAAQGYREVMRKHTFAHRVKQVLDTALPGHGLIVPGVETEEKAYAGV